MSEDEWFINRMKEVLLELLHKRTHLFFLVYTYCPLQGASSSHRLCRWLCDYNTEENEYEPGVTIQESLGGNGFDPAVADFNNDGLIDIAVSRNKKYERSYTEFDQKNWFGVFQQNENGSFSSIGAICGINDLSGSTLRMKMAQNHTWSDIDHDGLLDLFVRGRDTGGGWKRRGWGSVRFAGRGF